MTLFYLSHPSLIKKSGFFLPFVIRTKVNCQIHPSAKIELSGRLFFGDSKGLSLSAVPVNFQLSAESKIRFGKSVSIGPGVNLILKKGAVLEVGDNTYFTSDSHIEVVKTICIGSNCAISWGVTIIDDDHHKLLHPDKEESEQKVILGNHVWIGCNSTILKGTIIGDDSVVAAGSVVKGIFPAGSLLGGNPAKIIRTNVSWQ